MIRYTERDLSYSESNKRVILTFKVEQSEDETQGVSASDCVALSMCALFDILEENGLDPKAIIDEILKERVVQ